MSESIFVGPCGAEPCSGSYLYLPENLHRLRVENRDGEVAEWLKALVC
ncbi:hypothetical protein JYT16_00805 [Gemmatimonas aurantiaca]|nr:hypothetical protein [Gemmatimonas aurantiaca]